jgi:hypothetical protein
MDPETISIVFKTFSSVFPHVLVFSAQGGAITLVGSQSEITINAEMSERRFEEAKEIYSKYGISSPYDIYLYQLLTPFMFKALTDRVMDVHTLFAPILEYRASRAYFANLGENISDMVVESVPLPVPPDAVDGQFLYEKNKLDIPASAFVAAFEKTSSTMTHHRLKIVSLLQKKDSKNKLFDKENLWYQTYVALLDSQELKLQQKPKSQERLVELQGLVGNFRMLVAIGQRPRLSKMVAILERDCTTDNCYAEKRLAVAGLGRVQISKIVAQYPAQNPTLEQASLVATEWEKIKELYKKLGAY